MPNFDHWFQAATGNQPFPYQRQFAVESEIRELIDVPTGLGKTAMAVLGWLWRRRFHNGEAIQAVTPRRLVYCLPRRVLVEQTHDNVVRWLYNLGLIAGSVRFDGADGQKISSYALDFSDSSKIAVHILMGGEDEEDWDVYPERDQIIIGTQDMLLSRALNRGYAATRSRWPMQFGLLNNDCLWVFDEIQLMGSGLATTSQLEAFRRLIPDKGRDAAGHSHGCRSVWMSATMRRKWLKTVDFQPFVDSAGTLKFEFEKEINAPGLDDAARSHLRSRWKAKKPLTKAASAMGDSVGLVEEILKKHQPGTRTILVVNTVSRACELYTRLETANHGLAKQAGKNANAPNIEKDANAIAANKPVLILLHSRFRPGDRKRQVEQALSEPGESGTIVVSTQVIEAGVDVSATTLFTELAPWASLVQRFGRCNRRGWDRNASVLWIAASPTTDAKEAEGVAAPYKPDDLRAAERQLNKLSDAGPESLESLGEVTLDFEHTHVIRRKDMIDLFDTTPDLSGNDIDIDRFVREAEESDVRVFWRDWEQPVGYESPPEDGPAPRREELCPAPIGEFKTFAKDPKRQGKVWHWSFLDRKWERADTGKIAPGQVFLVHSKAGGYTTEEGWNPDSPGPVKLVDSEAGMKSEQPDATDDDRLSRIGVWQTVAEHSQQVSEELEGIVNGLRLVRNETQALIHAARWHDRGKTHDVFQTTIDDGQVVERKGQTIQRRERPQDWRGCRFVAKAPDKQKNADGQVVDPGFWRPYDWVPEDGRRHFRHELASALSVLDPRNGQIPDEFRNLVAYMVAAHHGKVRLSIRSLPNEKRPPDGNRRFARGIWDGDELPAADLGEGVAAPTVRLSLEPMELGLCEQEPFTSQASWAERMIGLRDDIGPFRLAYLEAILRAADMRASRAAARRAANSEIAGATQTLERGRP